MPTSNAERPTRRGMIQGRESRNQTLTTKLTEAEQRAVKRAAQADCKTTGEWLRDLTLRALETNATDAQAIALSEVLGIRLLLVNVLRSLGAGQKLTTEAFDKLLDEIGVAKHELAAKLIAERRR